MSEWVNVGQRLSSSSVGVEPNEYEPDRLHTRRDVPDPDSTSYESEEGEDPVPHLSGKKYVGQSYLCAIGLSIVSLLCMGPTIYCIIRSIEDASQYYDQFSIAPSVLLFKWDCNQLRWLNAFFHFLLNAFGSLLVGVSAYLQQLCTCPTYQDIKDGIKPEGGEVKFGSALPWTLFRRGRIGPISVWVLLVITSLPLHLALNSALGYAYTSLDLNWLILRENELKYQQVPISAWNNATFPKANWVNVSQAECQNWLLEYDGFDIDLTGLIIIVNDTGPINNLGYYLPPPTNESSNPNLTYIEYCYENKVESQCGITLRWAPLLVFSLSTLFKSAVILVAMKLMSHFQQPLYNNIGDILDLAVQDRDIIPQGECLLDAQTRKKYIGMPPGIDAKARRVPWRKLMGVSDWITYGFLYFTLGALIFNIYDATTSYFTYYQTTNIIKIYVESGWGDPFKVLWTYNYLKGQLDSAQLLALIFLGNAPQVWLSILILLLSNYVNRVWLEAQWRGFYCNPKYPRVSSDAQSRLQGGNVKEPRFLMLPYPLTIFLMLFGTIGHWLVSEAFFTFETSATFYDEYTGQTYGQGLFFFLTHSPGVIAVGGLVCATIIVVVTIHMFIPWPTTWMPIMNGSVRVVLASCTKLDCFPSGGVAWGDICENGKRVAGFAGIVKPLVEGAIYPSTVEARGNLEEQDGLESETKLTEAEPVDSEMEQQQRDISGDLAQRETSGVRRITTI